MCRTVWLLALCLLSAACGYNPRLDYGDVGSGATSGAAVGSGGTAAGGISGAPGVDTGAGGAVGIDAIGTAGAGGSGDAASPEADVVSVGDASDVPDVPIGATGGTGGGPGRGGAVGSGGAVGAGGAVGSGGNPGNGGISGSGGAAPQPVVSDFSASPATVTAGKTSTLSWVASGATTLSIDQGVGVVTGTSVTVSPAKTTSYTLTAQNADGASVKKSATVTVVPLPTISHFTVAPETISAGSRTTMTVSFVDGYQATIDQGVGAIDSGASFPVGPLSATTTFTLTVANAAGDSVTAKATVNVVPLPTITSFKAAPTPIASGASTTLTATFANGTGVVDHGIGSVTTTLGASTGALSATTIYTLTVTNPAGDVANAKATVTVASPGSFAGVPMVLPRGGAHTATLLSSGKVLITGGHGGEAIYGSAEEFDPATETFTAVGQMKAQRFFHTATLLTNGKVLVCGGVDPVAGGVHSAAELYDPATATFASTGPMTTPRSYHSAVRLGDGTVLVSGGQGSVELNTAELYDPTTGAFKALTNTMSRGREQHTTLWLPVLGKTALLGGDGGVGVDFYDPATQTFSGAGNMRIYRVWSAVTLMGNGKILTAGGFNENSSVLKSAEVYDPGTQSSSTTGDLNTQRGFHASVLLDNGQVLISGGTASNGADVLASAELYDPTTGVFKATGAMLFPRSTHTATALPNRRVLIVGGKASQEDPGAELYFY